MHVLNEMAVGARQHVHAVIIGGLVAIRVEEASEQRMLRIDLVIHSACRDPFVRLKAASEPHFAARIVRFWEQLLIDQVHRHF